MNFSYISIGKGNDGKKPPAKNRREKMT